MDLISTRALAEGQKIIAITKSEGSISRNFIDKIEEHHSKLIVVKTSKIIKSDSKIFSEIFNLIANLSTGYIIFLSSNAVEVFFEIATTLNIVNEIVQYLNSKFNVVAIGPSTQTSLKKHRIAVKEIPNDHSSIGIINFFSQIKNNRIGAEIIIPRSKKADKYLKKKLAKLGFVVHEFYIYTVIPADLDSLWIEFFDLLRKNKIDSLIFTSPSNVNYFFKILQQNSSDLLPLVCKIKMVLSIGPLTSKELIKFNIPFSEATDHSLEGIYKKLYINE